MRKAIKSFWLVGYKGCKCFAVLYKLFPFLNHKYKTVLRTETLLESALQGRRNGFQSGGAMKHWKVLSGKKKKILNSRGSAMPKIVTFRPWWQPFNSYCSKTLSFFPLFPFFFLPRKKWWAFTLPAMAPIPHW